MMKTRNESFGLGHGKKAIILIALLLALVGVYTMYEVTVGRYDDAANNAKERPDNKYAQEWKETMAAEKTAAELFLSAVILVLLAHVAEWVYVTFHPRMEHGH